jgi:group II intron reverse transcriptase/maturase
MSNILQAIWEPEFRNCSYGFRPGRSAHDALRRVDEIIYKERTQYVVEADIKGFFNHVHHEYLMRFVEHRVKDPNFLRLIRRFLKGGVMEDGVFSASEEGTPQGGLISPVLSNIYLHYVLDLWFEKRFAKSCKGKARLVRYADDFIACFEYAEDAERYLTEVQVRLADFALEIEPSKTRSIPFGSRMLGKPRSELHTFNFLGFTHFVARTRKGGFKVSRKTENKRFRTKLRALGQKLKALRTKGGKAMVQFVQRHLQGHMQYYGVSENFHRVSDYFYHGTRLLFKWLNRRSQRKSYSWAKFGARIQDLLPRPKVVHSFYAKPT